MATHNVSMHGSSSSRDLDHRDEERLPDHPQSVRIIGNTVSFRGKLDHFAAEMFFELPYEVRRRARAVSFSRVSTIYNAGIIPVIADFFQNRQRVEVRADRNRHVDRLLSLYGWRRTLQYSQFDRLERNRQALTWLPTDELTYAYQQHAFEEAARRMRNVARNVVPGFYWALAELLGNVFHHAESPIGVLSQYLLQKTNRRLTFTLVDTGMGLKKSLLPTHPDIVSDRQAIQEAIRQGVTSKRENLGMGLFGSTRIVQLTGGNMILWSGSSSMWIDRNGEFSFRDVPYFQGTIIEWQLPVDAEYDLSDALRLPQAPVIWLSDKYTTGELSGIRMRLVEESKTFGDRATGRRLQTKLLNLIRQSNAKHVEVDFSNVLAMSSSFADEFIAKTMVLYGPKFEEFVRLSNLSKLSREVIDTAVQHRLLAERSAQTPLRVVRESAVMK